MTASKIHGKDVLLIAVLASGCASGEKVGPDTAAVSITDTTGDTGTDTAEVDADGDGHPAGEDCDDSDPAVYKNAVDTLGLGIGPDCGGMVVSARRYGEQADDYETFVGAAGDVNGDGYQDVLVNTALYADEDGVRVSADYLVAGPITGDESLATAEARITGVAADQTEAGVIEGLGDSDGDGYGDLALERVSMAADGESDPLLLLGPVSGSLNMEESDGIWSLGSHASAQLGGRVDDVNDDGFADLMFGLDDEEADKSAGIAFGPLSGDHTFDDLSVTFVGATGGIGLGDLDGDGVEDVGIEGWTSVFSGPLSGAYAIADADATFIGGGWVVDGGDFDGDGKDDLLLKSDSGADGESGDDDGAIFIYHGPVYGEHDQFEDADASLFGGYEENIAFFGPYAADLNGDGLCDLLVGPYPDEGFSLGEVYAFLGPISGTQGTSDAWWEIVGRGPTYYNPVYLGPTVGDTNGDGYGDAVLMETGASIVNETDGAFYLLLGGPTW